MPNKYPEKKNWSLPKQKYKLTNWPVYNQALGNRGDIEFWITEKQELTRSKNIWPNELATSEELW
jgi:hypothetical protein